MIRSAALAVLCSAGLAQAQIYLTSANAYICDPSTGANVAGAWEFDNIPVTSGNAEMVINATPRGTTHALALGDNLFAFQVWSGVNPNHAIGLWFGDTPAHFPGPVGAGQHLIAYRSALGPLATPAAGVMVNTWNSVSGDGPYSGATSYSVGGMTATVTAYQFDGASGQGTFTINVVPVPAPAALPALALAGLVGLRRRR